MRVVDSACCVDLFMVAPLVAVCEYTLAEQCIARAAQRLHIDVGTAGVLGRRTRFQTSDLPQLTVQVVCALLL
jgi:hypothetical protein